MPLQLGIVAVRASGDILPATCSAARENRRQVGMAGVRPVACWWVVQANSERRPCPSSSVFTLASIGSSAAANADCAGSPSDCSPITAKSSISRSRASPCKASDTRQRQGGVRSDVCARLPQAGEGAHLPRGRAIGANLIRAARVVPAQP